MLVTTGLLSRNIDQCKTVKSERSSLDRLRLTELNENPQHSVTNQMTRSSTALLTTTASMALYCCFPLITVPCTSISSHLIFIITKPVLHLLFPPLKFSISYKCMRWEKNTFLGRKSYFASSRYTLLAKSEPQSYSQHNTYLFQHDFLYILYILPNNHSPIITKLINHYLFSIRIMISHLKPPVPQWPH